MPEPDFSLDSATPPRVLGLGDAACIVIGAIVGVGIFFTPSSVVRLTGSGGLALVAWAVAGGIALCGALTFAGLGRRYHASGAQYQALRDAFGPLVGFLFVFCNATAIQAGAIGVIALVCADNLGVALGRGAPAGAARLVLGCALIALLTTANILGVRWGSRIQNLTVYAKLLTLLGVTVLAMTMRAGEPPGPDRMAPVAPAGALGGVGAVLAALVPCFFAYGGFQHALWITGEIRDPARTLPRAIIGGVAVVVAVYLLANWAYLRLLGADGVAATNTLAADAVAVVWPETGRRLIAAAVAFSAFGVLNAQLLSGPRLIYGMARDGRFFAPFARVSPRLGTPVAAILLLGLAGLGLVVAAGEDAINRLLTGAVFVDGVFFAVTGAALLVLSARATRGSADPPTALRGLGYPVAPLVFVLGALGIVAGACLAKEGWVIAVVGAGWIAAAALVYLVFFRSRAGGTGPSGA